MVQTTASPVSFGSQGAVAHFEVEDQILRRKYDRLLHWLRLEIAVLICTVLLTIAQLAIFDIYLVAYGDESVDSIPFVVYEEYHIDINCTLVTIINEGAAVSYRHIWYWIVPDLIAVGAMMLLPIFSTLNYINVSKRKIFEKEASVRNTLRYASIIWFVYSIVLVCKIAISSSSFLKVLQFFEFCDAFRMLDLNTFVLMLCLSCVIFLTIVGSHHVYNPHLKEWLSALISGVTFEVLDAVHFLSILFNTEVLPVFMEQPNLENAIIIFSCLNFILPTVSLLKVHKRVEETVSGNMAPLDTPEEAVTSQANTFSRTDEATIVGLRAGKNAESGSKGEQGRSSVKVKRKKSLHKRRVEYFIEEDCYHFLFLIFVNIPYFVIRVYLWHYVRLELSVFLLKNAISILLGIQKLASGLYYVFRKIT